MTSGKSVYRGEFSKGNFHGQGTFINASGYKYVGEWENGIESGKGSCILLDGAEYNGDFIDGAVSYTHLTLPTKRIV